MSFRGEQFLRKALQKILLRRVDFIKGISLERAKIVRGIWKIGVESEGSPGGQSD